MMFLEKARAVAERVVDQLRPFCKRIEVAGSIRRRCSEVGDVDLVIETTQRHALMERVQHRCKVLKGGEQYVVAVMPDGTQLDLWFSHVAPQNELFAHPDPKPDNFGSILLSRTGSTFHNMALCERAKRFGMNWNPHWGIYQAGVCIASKTEEDIYRALGMPFLPPTAREFTTRDEQMRLINAPLWRE